MSYQITDQEWAGRPGLKTGSFPLSRLVNLLVWLTFATSGYVLMNPAPVDGLMIGLIFLIPLAGLARFSPLMFFWLALMLLIVAAGYIGVVMAYNIPKAMMHMHITLYLSLGAFILAGYIAKNPHLHLTIIMRGYVVAALLGTSLGLAGYLDLFPGAYEKFTLYQRVKGGFKDPNVYGPFLVPVILYALHQMLNRRFGAMLFYSCVAGFLSLGLLLSFSRGAWLHLLLSGGLFAWFTFMFSGSPWQRTKLVLLIFMGVVLMGLSLAGILQIPKVAHLLEQRASLTQSYDTGTGGRFEGHVKARTLIAEHPLGIGPVQFGGFYHKEDIHNVYYQMFLSMGWVGGFSYLLLVFGTLWSGLRHLLRPSTLKPWLHLALASLIALMLEGTIIDTDHWRHFYLLLAIIWGVVAHDKWAARRQWQRTA